MAGDTVHSDGELMQVVPNGHLWLTGDNLANSQDSRRYGAVSESLCRSRLLWRLWPLERFGPIS